MSDRCDSRALGVIAGGVFLTALAVRLVWQAVVTPVDWPDTAVYEVSGRELFEHGLMTSERYMPLYPIIIHLFGPDGVLSFQALLSAATGAMVAVLAGRLFHSRSAALIGGAIAVFHPLLIFYANMRLSETLFLFLFTGAVLAYYHRRWAVGAVLLVLGILTRPSVDFIAPLLILAFCLVHRERLSAGLVARRLGTYAVIYVALMTPWWLHNLQSYGHFVRLDLGDGSVIRLENNPLFDRVGLDFAALAPALDGGPGDRLAQNAALKQAAFAYIAADPSHYLERCIERFGRFWSPVPGSPKPAVNLIAFAATVPVFLGAFVCLARGDGARWRSLLPLLLVGLFLTAVHTAFHGLPRYRLPLEPFLIVLAAGWYGGLVDAVLGRRGAAARP